MNCCYFDLGVIEEPLSLVFYIANDLKKFSCSLDTRVVENITKKMVNIHPYFRRLLDPQLNLFEDSASFNNMFDNYFGLHQTIKVEQANDYLKLVAPIPAGTFYLDEICLSCCGTKIDRQYLEAIGSETKCRDCGGSGYRSKTNYHQVRDLTNNVCLLTDIVDRLAVSIERKLVTQQPMLMCLKTFNDGYNKQDIYGFFSEYFVKFLEFVIANDLVDNLVLETRRIMARAYSFMMTGKNGYTERQLYDFQVIISRRDSKSGVSFYLKVPGVNSCSVFPTGDSMGCLFYGDEKVFALTCHNIDSPSQQLSLVIGLAYLSGKARDWLNQ